MKHFTRKQFLQTAGLATAGAVLSGHTAANSSRQIKAIAFDAFPVFDPRPVFKAVHDMFPEKGRLLTETWRAKQFGYQWLRATAGNYKNFWQVTHQAFVHAAKAHGVVCSPAQLQQVMESYNRITVWPDVAPALQKLQAMGLPLCFLTNMTEAMIRQGMDNSGISTYFTHVLSTDSIQTYKPAPAAYQLGVNTLKLKKHEILFVAFAGWDAAGAKWFGYPTYWVNRLQAVADELDATPDGEGHNLDDLVQFISLHNEAK